MLRNLIGAAGRIAAVGYEEANDAEVAIDRAEGILFEISQRRTVGGFESLATLLGQAYDRLEYLHEHRGQLLGIPPGSSELDTLLGGFQPSDLIILAARPSVGKTSLALNIAQHAAVHEGKKVGVFSLEMSKEQLALRLLSAESGINPRPLQSRLRGRDGLVEDRAGHERDARGADVDRRLAGPVRHGAAHQGPPAGGGAARPGPASSSTTCS